MKKTLLGLLAFSMMSATALAADIKPALIFDLGGKFDKSFNEAAFNGAEKFKTETGIEYREFEISNDAQREQALRRFAGDGNNPIVIVGFNWAPPLEKLAAEYPDTKFAIIDTVVDKPNVKSIVFKEQEGSYLVGVLAGLASKSKTVSFVGGMDIPLIHKFACGYIGGAKSTGADVKVLEAYTGTTPDAWNDPVKGGEIAKSQNRSGLRRRLSRCRRHRCRCAPGGCGCRQARHRRGLKPERAPAWQGPDLHAQARRCSRPTKPSRPQRMTSSNSAPPTSASRKMASALRSTTTTRR